MNESISDIRKRAWVTRRQKYGAMGHNSSYTRSPGPCADCERMRALIIRLHAEGILTEGQASKATGLHRIDIRAGADELFNSGAVPDLRECNNVT